MKMLAIGMFDGVHRGHQALLSHLNEESTVITFSNHPAAVLQGKAPLSLSSLSLKCALLKTYSPAQQIVMPFTPSLAVTAFEAFLEPFSFQHLILGDGAVFGKDGLGNASALQELGKRRGFTVQIISKSSIASQTISSSRIRSLIQTGNLAEAEHLLNHPYCIEYFSENPALFAALPPDGVYSIQSYSTAGSISSLLTIRNQTLYPATNQWQLISFSNNLNPDIFRNLCQTSPAAS